jgi:site-specific DNA recombinase
MVALWDVATSQERRDMVTLILQSEGLYYDTELKMIAAMKKPVDCL